MTDNAIVRSGRNPLSATVLAVFAVSGVLGLLDPSQASPILRGVLGHYVWIWHGGLVIGSATALVGVTVLKPLNDVLVERIGMVWLATLFLSYFVAVCANDSAFFSTYSGIVLGLGLAFAMRAWQITRDLRRLHRALQALPRLGPTKSR